VKFLRKSTVLHPASPPILGVSEHGCRRDGMERDPYFARRARILSPSRRSILNIGAAAELVNLPGDPHRLGLDRRDHGSEMGRGQ
jgi:hypothetical protein